MDSQEWKPRAFLIAHMESSTEEGGVTPGQDKPKRYKSRVAELQLTAQPGQLP